MKLQPISNEEEYKKILEFIDIQFSKKLNPDSAEGIILQNALRRVKAYEDIHPKIRTTRLNGQ